MADRRATPRTRTTGTKRAASGRWARWRARLGALPWVRIAVGTALVLGLVAVVPPLRDFVARGASRVVLTVASPLAPDIGGFDALPASTRLLAADGSVIAELDESERRRPLELSQLPPHVAKAVLAAEDENFYAHSGVDPGAVFRALLRNAQGGRTQGGSTITQQLAKLNYTERERTFARKLKELLYASELEKSYSKDELLERYLNQVYFGDGAYGIAAAAETTFGKIAKELTVAEAATLAGRIRSPETLNPREKPEEVRRRRNQVLVNMHEEGWLDRAGLEEARRAPLKLAPARTSANQAVVAPHFVEYVKREARTIDALGGSPEARAKQLFTGGYTIETTLDRREFDATVKAVEEVLGRSDDPVTSVASVVPGDGAIGTIFGGLDFATTQFDVASISRNRQPGSAFKPFVYLAAIRDGIDPRSTFDGSSPRRIPCYGEVRNYAGEDAGGRVDVDTALKDSVNTVFADLGCEVGARNVKRAAVDAGIPDDIEAQPAMFLGGLDKSATGLQMAAAYATFAARGVYAEPYAIKTIRDRAGRLVYTHEPRTRKAFEPEEVGLLNAALQRVVREGTGRGAAIGRPVAGKTGTTSENRDAWFVGYVPQRATAVWVGYPDPKPMSDVRGRPVTGGSFPATIFARVMQPALEGLPVRTIPTADPDDLDLVVRRPPRGSSGDSDTTTTTADTTTTSSSTTSSSSTTTSSSTSTSTTTQTTTPPTTVTTRRTTTTTSTTTTTTTTTVPS